MMANLYRRLAQRPAMFLIAVGIAMVAGAIVGAFAATTTGRSQSASAKRPNLNGIWQSVNTAAWDIQDHNAALDLPGGQSVVDGNEIPYQPWALAQKAKNFEQRASADPLGKCYLPGIPRLMYLPWPFQIVQTGGYVTILSEFTHTTRTIYTNGSTHPARAVDLWLGDSRGRWEGESLVVDVTGFNGETWFDKAGNFHSDQLHVVERFTPKGPDHLLYEATIEDPKVFTRPWKISLPLYRRVDPGVQLLEYECVEYLERASQETK